MKKRGFILLISVLLIIGLTACSSAGESSNDAAYGMPTEAVAPQAPSLAAMDGAGNFDFAVEQEWTTVDMAGDVMSPLSDVTGTVIGLQPTAISADRIVYTADIQLVAKDFALTIEGIDAVIAHYDGFIEFSSREATTNNDRFARYTIRIPSNVFQTVVREIEALGDVQFSTSNAENITAQYADVQARLANLRTQEERILSFMQEASKVEDLITLERRLSEINFEIERLTTSRNEMDSRLAFSTIHVFVSETPEALVHATASIADAGNVFTNSIIILRNVVVGFVLVMIALIPWIVVLGLISVPVVYGVKKARKKKKVNQQEVKQVEP